MSTAPRVPDTPPNDRAPMSLPRLAEMKENGEQIVMVTAYDYPSAKVAEEAGVDLVLVGDSGAMTVLGHDSTVPVGMDEMLMLAAAVRRGLKTPLLVGDMPFGSYEQSNEQAIANAQRFIKEAGCERRQARARRRLGRPGAGDRPCRDPGHGPRRPDAADRDAARRLQGTGPDRRDRLEDRRGRLRAAGGRLLRGRLRGRPGRGQRGDHAAHGGPGDRDRRRRLDRRTGARLPRPARHQHRPRRPLRQALRRDPRGDGRRASARTPPRSARAASRTRSTPTRSIPTSSARCATTSSRTRWPPTPPGTGRTGAP